MNVNISTSWNKWVLSRNRDWAGLHDKLGTWQQQLANNTIRSFPNLESLVNSELSWWRMWLLYAKVVDSAILARTDSRVQSRLSTHLTLKHILSVTLHVSG